MSDIISAQTLYKNLLQSGIIGKTGSITFTLNGVTVKINTTDTVGITLQAWLKQYLVENNFYQREPNNTQEFPDFYLGEDNVHNMLEIKAFHYSRTPAFDIANFESYCDSVKEKPTLFKEIIDVYMKKRNLTSLEEVANAVNIGIDVLKNFFYSPYITQNIRLV